MNCSVPIHLPALHIIDVGSVLVYMWVWPPGWLRRWAPNHPSFITSIIHLPLTGKTNQQFTVGLSTLCQLKLCDGVEELLKCVCVYVCVHALSCLETKCYHKVKNKSKVLQSEDFVSSFSYSQSLPLYFTSDWELLESSFFCRTQIASPRSTGSNNVYTYWTNVETKACSRTYFIKGERRQTYSVNLCQTTALTAFEKAMARISGLVELMLSASVHRNSESFIYSPSVYNFHK